MLLGPLEVCILHSDCRALCASRQWWFHLITPISREGHGMPWSHGNCWWVWTSLPWICCRLLISGMLRFTGFNVGGATTSFGKANMRWEFVFFSFFLNDDDVYVAELMVLPYGVYPFWTLGVCVHPDLHVHAQNLFNFPTTSVKLYDFC